MIQRENEVINHRVTWLTTVQGLLFTAVGIVWDKQGAEPFIRQLCCLGIIMAFIAFFALHGATLAIKRLFEWWEIKKPQDYSGPGVIGLPLPKCPILRFFGPWIVYTHFVHHCLDRSLEHEGLTQTEPGSPMVG